ncbi:hypothetical protein QVD17_19915 [Tagetes erecta]|uniref:Uncharacterized protein n=1 Tax=Tagetes erecta TaxID=13708 RepID=A0AAD8KKH3_TARER|nr:hypothetical protein QVD17_19915 [Tagetes erecta]
MVLALETKTVNIKNTETKAVMVLRSISENANAAKEKNTTLSSKRKIFKKCHWSRFIHDVYEDISICDPEKELTISSRENMPDFDISQHLHMIHELLPVMENLNQEKMVELDNEAIKKGYVMRS